MGTPSLFAPVKLDHTFTVPSSGDTEYCAVCGGLRGVHPEHAPTGQWALPMRFYKGEGKFTRHQSPRAAAASRDGANGSEHPLPSPVDDPPRRMLIVVEEWIPGYRQAVKIQAGQVPSWLPVIVRRPAGACSSDQSPAPQEVPARALLV